MRKHHILICLKAGLVYYDIIIIPKWFGKQGLSSITQCYHSEMQIKLSVTIHIAIIVIAFILVVCIKLAIAPTIAHSFAAYRGSTSWQQPSCP